MRVLICGGTGATGKWLVQHLIEGGHDVRVIVRSAARLPEAVRGHERLTVVEASLLDLSDEQLAAHVADCDAVASCLGHNLSLAGVFGPPWRLVTNAVRRLCEAARAADRDKPLRFVLMSSTGVRNHDLVEPISIAQHVVLALLRVVIQPHPDNEQAANYLRTKVGQDDAKVQWVAVRPDGLIDEDQVTPYDIHPSPTRSAIFDAGKVSRINVAHFMAELVGDDALWAKWRGRMPAIYSREDVDAGKPDESS